MKGRMEQGKDYYNQRYQVNRSTSIYTAIYTEAARHCTGRVLDMGCGQGVFRKFLPPNTTYDGFDFAEQALGPGLRQGDLYTEPLEGYDTYVLLEVLEHVDDLAVLQRIPTGGRVVLSVPSYGDTSHLRVYPRERIVVRFSDLLHIDSMQCFERQGRLFVPVEQPKEAYITLVCGHRKEIPA